MRAALAAAVTERNRAAREAKRLDGRAVLPGAAAEVAAAADEQRRLEAATAERIERLRADLRRLEGELATLEAADDRDRAGAGGGGGGEGAGR